MIRASFSGSGEAVDAPAAVRNGLTVLRSVQQSKLFKDYQEAFETATGFPLVLRAAGSFQVPLAGSKRLNPFCELMTQTNRNCSDCLQFQQRAEGAAHEQSKTLRCHAGLSETLVPVRVGEQVLGYLQTGQVLLAAASAAQWARIERAQGPIGSGVSRQAWRDAYFRTRVIAPRQYRAIIRLLVIFAQHLAEVSNQLLTRGNAAESPVIAKVRAFVAERHEDPLSLDDVARAVHMSPCHFCKFFKRATGLTFTDYLARARVESVKQRLQDANVRVSEAAFGAGFQSLSQFNRVFRRVAGESPTRYRTRLHGTAPQAARVAPRRTRVAVG